MTNGIELEFRPLTILKDEFRYEGEWIKSTDIIDGKGILFDPLGIIRYQGSFSNNQKSGYGEMRYFDSIYRGNWKKDRRNGHGILIQNNGKRYEGEWLDDKRHGFGIEELPSKYRYEGRWKLGNYHGKGRYTQANGRYYDGDWFENQPHGNGMEFCEDGATYSGEWC